MWMDERDWERTGRTNMRERATQAHNPQPTLTRATYLYSSTTLPLEPGATPVVALIPRRDRAGKDRADAARGRTSCRPTDAAARASCMRM